MQGQHKWQLSKLKMRQKNIPQQTEATHNQPISRAQDDLAITFFSVVFVLLHKTAQRHKCAPKLLCIYCTKERHCFKQNAADKAHRSKTA